MHADFLPSHLFRRAQSNNNSRCSFASFEYFTPALSTMQIVERKEGTVILLFFLFLFFFSSPSLFSLQSSNEARNGDNVRANVRLTRSLNFRSKEKFSIFSWDLRGGKRSTIQRANIANRSSSVCHPKPRITRRFTHDDESSPSSSSSLLLSSPRRRRRRSTTENFYRKPWSISTRCASDPR